MTADSDESTDDDGPTSTRRRYLGAAVAAGVAVVGATSLLADPADDHPWFRPDDPEVLVIAHRGGAALRPDNTLAAFEHAASLGVDVVEVDVHLTADDVPVCVHDPTVDDRTDGTGRVDEHTLAELRALDGAYGWQPPDGDGYPYRGEGLEIPTLAEAFLAHPDLRWNVGLKPAVDDVEPVCDVIADHGMTEQTLVASFGPQVDAVRRHSPGVATATHRTEAFQFFLASRLSLEATYDASAEALQVPPSTSGVTVLTPGFVEAAHRRGMDVHAWTINERAEMERLAAMGVDGLFTDRPGRALSVLGRR